MNQIRRNDYKLSTVTLKSARSIDFRKQSKSKSSKEPGKDRTIYHGRKTLLRRSNRHDITIYYDEKIVTPCKLPLINSNEYESISDLDLDSTTSIFDNLTGTALQSQIQQSFMSTVNYGSRTATIYNFKQSVESLFENDSDSFSIQNSEETEDYMEYIEPPLPSNLKINLSETPVINLLDILSTTIEKNSDEADFLEGENDYYEYITSEKGRNRKTQNAETQTNFITVKTKGTDPRKRDKRNKIAMASFWDIYDSMKNKSTTENQSKSSKKSINPKLLPKSSPTTDDKAEKLGRNPKFHFAVLIMERALAHNIYFHEQRIFRGLFADDPFRPNIQFKYRLHHLWTFKCSETEGRPIVCMQWHPINADLIACGYGKFKYNDNFSTGTVCCWNIKNPLRPELIYHFKNPVTSLCFSKHEPSLLSVGFYNGSVALLCITNNRLELLMATDPSKTELYDPIWDLDWFDPDDFKISDEHLISVSEDGSVCYYVVRKDMIELTRVELLRISPSNSRRPGVYYPKSCTAKRVPITKNDSAMKIVKHPVEPGGFLIGTGEGTIHKCTESYENQRLDIFMAHIGPVYNIQFSKFCQKLFLSCGYDGCIRIWMEGIQEPLVTLSNHCYPIDGAEWCPANSTIIANISNALIFIWDLQRKTYAPVSKHKNPYNHRNTVIKFDLSGNNLAVGDIQGNLHIYAFVEVPFPPFYQAEMLEKVMYRNISLLTKQDLIKKIQKFGFNYRNGESMHMDVSGSNISNALNAEDL